MPHFVAARAPESPAASRPGTARWPRLAGPATALPGCRV